MANARAQSRFTGGLEIGASASQLSGDALSGFDKFGLVAGPYIRANFTEKSSAKLAIQYINKGSRRNADLDNGIFGYAIRLNYVEVPILYSYTYEKIKGEAGLAVGTLVSSTELGTDGVKRDFVFPFETIDLSLAIGASYFLSDNIFAGIRWTQSVIPVRKSPSRVNANSFYEAGMYNTVIQVMIGYEF